MLIRKGILLAGGTGTRLHPVTKTISKQLLPVYDKPMIYYPICTLMHAGIRDILIITTPNDLENFKLLLGDGSQWGIKLNYKVQQHPDGLAQAFLIGEDFIQNNPSVLILGDNIFYGPNMEKLLKDAGNSLNGATVFAYHVKDPEHYGVVEFDESNKVISIEEKPTNPRSNYAVTGLYFYDESVVEYAKSLKPSRRKELEITDLNQIYLKKNKLNVEIMDRGYAWLDTGTHDSLIDAGIFISTIQNRQGIKVSCPEEVAFKKGWITSKDLEVLARDLLKNDYGKYLLKVSQEID